LTIFAESYEGSASFVKVLGGEPEFAETAEAKYGRGQIRLAQECFGIGVQPDGGEDIDDAGKPNA
jgi:hypothetical protein